MGLRYRVQLMEQTTASASFGARRRDVGVIRITQIGLLLACVGAVLIIFNLFGWAIAGLVMVAVGAVLAARGGLGHGWWFVVAGGAALAILSRIIAEGSETLGGWLAVVACLAVLCGATIGFPSAAEEPE